MGIGKRILNVLIGLLFIISVTVLGSSFLAKKVLVDAISQAGVDTAISHRMMDAVFGYAGADDTEWIAKIQNKIEKNGEVQAITQKVMNEITEDLSSGKAYKDVDVTKELNRILDDSMQEIKDTNPELSDDMLAMMKQQLKEELVDVQDVLNSYASNLYDNMNDTSTVQGKVAKLYTILLSMPCRVAAGAAILILAVLTILLGYPRYRGLFSLGVEGLICGVIFAPGIGLMGNKVLSLLTDRILGRTIDVNLKAFLWMGCISAGAGVVFLLAGLIVSWKDDR
jgi:galactitol-specific phosphotransferase system IIB component